MNALNKKKRIGRNDGNPVPGSGGLSVVPPAMMKWMYSKSYPFKVETLPVPHTCCER